MKLPPKKDTIREMQKRLEKYAILDGGFIYFISENRQKILADIWMRYKSCLAFSNHRTLQKEAQSLRNVAIYDLYMEKVPLKIIQSQFGLSRDRVHKIVNEVSKKFLQ
jgi:hypothetical protein